ncbi:MAG: methionine gamma-lyase family protein [Oscillospiraceae bacterium]|nr:methionine gamma-lyase family protein [Oscillospiraceae bacterium]
MEAAQAEILIGQAEEALLPQFSKIDKTALLNQKKVLEAFWEHKISEAHFNPSTGYGYNDRGREALDSVWARVFESEAAFVRPHIVSGTHAITIGLFGLLRPGDCMLSVTGTPYDTLIGVIGPNGKKDAGSLADFGIKYRQTEQKNDYFDFDAISRVLQLDKSVKLVYAQKSRGYKDRAAVSSSGIGELVRFVKSINSDIYVAVDNCYGEFVEAHEPAYYGADMIMGSLIKNPGGGIAQCGGYIAGTKKAVGLAAHRLTAPLVGTEAGASLGQGANIYKGLFFAPHVVAQSLKTACLASYVYENLGYETSPKYESARYDIIQSVKFLSEEKLVNFVRGIQSGSAVDSHAFPEASEMPGYADKIIMASGSFTQGSSIEISADAPVRPPYTAYMQGALTYESGRICLSKALEKEPARA